MVDSSRFHDPREYFIRINVNSGVLAITTSLC